MQTRIVSAIELSVDECLAIGYRKSDLSCLSCEELTKFDLFSLKDSCLKCCSKDATEEGVKVMIRQFVLSVIFTDFNPIVFCLSLEVRFGPTRAFIRGDKSKKFPNLSVKYMRGADPVIKLLDAAGEEVDELNIQKWDTDTIDEFLEQHLAD
ncbi:unnamed protein product [Medioppia subpectinata]|uniref:Selenoprotein F n=1 Tax=Medioppia subpectinata TaxID=1979941 RepID=A0A7R9L1X8_9ACAR|nr:unnamed protein product [Medioppia subpectinata]CAG2113804.1 unnamed protein product [Medioppia subpectinata]